MVSTTYQREFNWPDPPPSEAPLLHAQHMLNSSKHPPSTHGHNGEGAPSATNGYNHSQSKESQLQYCHDCDHRRHGDDQRPVSSPSSMPHADKNRMGKDVKNPPKANLKRKQCSPKKPDKCRHHHHHHIRGEKQSRFIQDLMSKQEAGRDDKKAQRAKRVHKKMVKQFVTEYQRNFGKSYVGKSSKKSKG